MWQVPQGFPVGYQTVRRPTHSILAGKSTYFKCFFPFIFSQEKPTRIKIFLHFCQLILWVSNPCESYLYIDRVFLGYIQKVHCFHWSRETGSDQGLLKRGCFLV